MVFVSEKNLQWAEELRKKGEEDGRIVPVQALTRLSASAVLRETNPEVVKVDCEKCEALLLDVQPWLLKGPKAWVMETHTRDLYEDFQKLFKSLGYEVETVEDFPNNPPERCVKVILAYRVEEEV